MHKIAFPDYQHKFFKFQNEHPEASCRVSKSPLLMGGDKGEGEKAILAPTLTLSLRGGL